MCKTPAGNKTPQSSWPTPHSDMGEEEQKGEDLWAKIKVF